MKVSWTARADDDRGDIIAYIWLDNPAAAAYRVNDLIEAAVDRLATFRRSGREGDIEGTRELVPHPSYRIVYEVAESEVVILALGHTARQWAPVEGDNS